jgi:hypothetical protein
MPDCDTKHIEDALHERNIDRWRKSRMNHRWTAGETAVISSTNWGGVMPKQPAAHRSSPIRQCFTRKRVMSVGIGEALPVAPAIFQRNRVKQM